MDETVRRAREFWPSQEPRQVYGTRRPTLHSWFRDGAKMEGMPLDEYRRKRDFDKTSEPSGDSSELDDIGDARFVVQEHHARRLHWDLRLERDGVLASWALPKGVPTDPKRNHLAVPTEDHPLEYLTFEAEIPEGEYGGGVMTIWDTGTYSAEKFTSSEVIATFHGDRVQGKYALFKTGKARGGSGGMNWMIHRMDPPMDIGDPLPRAIVPMNATVGRLPHDDDQWAFEIKWDGVRTLAYAEPGELRLVSRTGRDVTAQYPEVRAMSRTLGSRRVVLDGELIAFDGGRPSFQRLQSRINVSSEGDIRRAQGEAPVVYIIFDLLYVDGRSLLRHPYLERRAELASLELAGAHWQVPDYQRGDGGALLAATRAQGLEGVMAKLLRSTYQPGRRSRQWLKIKNVRRQEVVIAGWVPGQGRRSDSLGALVVGVYDDDGAFRYAGKVGTGFTEVTLKMLRSRLAELEVDASPFEGREPQRDTVFVRPELVCEVEFSEWTQTGTLRQPSFQGLRDDKEPRGVVRE